jgi:beta-N-acetylhexosaminidase
VLVCRPDVVPEALASQREQAPCAPQHVATLRGTVAQTWSELMDNPQRERFIARIKALDTKEAA